MAKYEDLLNELVILEKKYLLYSHGHDFVNQAVLDLLRTMGDIHNTTPKIRIVDTGYNLVVNDMEFNASNIKVDYIMQLLGGRGILSVTFSKGVGFSSIMDFLYLLNSIPTNSKLLYHTDIQYSIHNIDSIEVEEMDYGSLRYGYGEDIKEEAQEENSTRVELYESLKSIKPEIDNLSATELVDVALEELSRMPQEKVTDFLQGLSYDVVSEIIERANARENSISPSLIDLLVAMDSARKLAGDERIEKPSEEISYDQVTKLVEREAYELYVTEDYRQHLRSLLAYDIKPTDSVSEIDLFDKTLINRTIVMALLNLTKNKLDNTMHVSFVDNIHSYFDEFIETSDWQFIHSIKDEKLINKYLRQDSTIKNLSETIRGNNSPINNYLVEVIQASGIKNLNWLFDSYLDEMDSRRRRGFLTLIQSFKEDATIYVIRRFIDDPTMKLSLLMPIVKDHLVSIPEELSSKLFSCDSSDAKLLAIRIKLTQGDDGIKGDIERFVKEGKDEFVLSLLDLIREFRITELIGTLNKKIHTIYINEKMLKFIMKTIDTFTFIDHKAYRDLDNRLMNTKFTLSPKNLGRIKKYLKGVSHEHKSR